MRTAGMSDRMYAAAIGPSIPPRPPARLTPPSTIADTPLNVYSVPASGEPTPVVIDRPSPPHAAKNPHTAEAGSRPMSRVTPDRQAAVRALPTAMTHTP